MPAFAGTTTREESRDDGSCKAGDGVYRQCFRSTG